MRRSGRRFHEAHKREYGHFFADNPIEIVNVRVVGVGQMPKIEKLTAPEGTTLAKARVRTGQCVFRIDGELRSFETAFYRRHLLPVGESFRRSRYRAAKGLDDGHSAGLHRDQ